MKKRVKFTSTEPDLAIPHPLPAFKVIPEWYRGSRASVNGIETVKSCVPFLDSMISGYMLVLSSDVFFQNGVPQDVAKIDTVGGHLDGQLGNLLIPPEYSQKVLKWMNPFIMETPKNYSTLFVHPSNRIDLPFYTFSGVVDTDKFPVQVNFPFIIKKDFVGIVPAGTPIAQAIPFKREDWQSEVEDTKPYTAPHFVYTMHNPPFKFYKKNFWQRKKYI